MSGLWIYLITLFVQQTFEDSSRSKYARVLNIARLYMQCYTKFWIFLNMAQYVSIICESALTFFMIWPKIVECLRVSLKIPESAVLIIPSFLIFFIILDVWQGFEYVSDIKYARVLIMQRYSYNNLVIVTNDIIWEFLFYQFVRPSTPHLTILSF